MPIVCHRERTRVAIHIDCFVVNTLLAMTGTTCDGDFHAWFEIGDFFPGNGFLTQIEDLADWVAGDEV